MGDDDLRGRFRRDFTNEVTDSSPRHHAHRPQPQPAQRPPVTDLRQHQHEPAAQPMFPPVMAEPPARHEPPRARDLPAPARHHNQTAQSTVISQPKVKKHRSLKIPVIILLIVLLAAGGGIFYSRQQIKVPIPLSTRASLKFPLLYPTKLPSGYKIDQSSYSVSQGTLVYNAKNGDSSAEIDFTVKKLPAGFNFDAFYKQGLSNAAVFNTPIGEAAIGTAGGRLVGSLHTNNSWLLASPASDNLNAGDINQILQSVKSAAVPKN